MSCQLETIKGRFELLPTSFSDFKTGFGGRAV
jgi:hypothetical protein